MITSTFRLFLLSLSVSVSTAIIIFLVIRCDFQNAAGTEFDSPGPRAASTLQYLTIFARHGNRAPYSTFPGFPYPANDTDIWPYGPLQLTVRGRVQSYKLGVKIRSLYNGFLSQIYTREELKAYSTVTDRTLMSAELFLAGLYPPQGDQMWDEQILWQPIPVFPDSLDHTPMMSKTTLCPAFHEARIKSSIELDKEFGSNMTYIMKTVQPYTGENLDYENLTAVKVSLYNLWESLNCAESEGLPLPTWSKIVYREPLQSLMIKVFLATSVATDDKMIRLYEGSLFQKMKNFMQSKIDGKLPDLRIYFHSGHDYTLLGLQSILGVLNSDSAQLVVETASALIFELHKELQNDQYYVKVLYIDGASSDLEPSEINIPGCHSPCDFTLLMNMTEQYYNITDWEKECQIST